MVNLGGLTVYGSISAICLSDVGKECLDGLLSTPEAVSVNHESLSMPFQCRQLMLLSFIVASCWESETYTHGFGPSRS